MFSLNHLVEWIREIMGGYTNFLVMNLKFNCQVMKLLGASELRLSKFNGIFIIKGSCRRWGTPTEKISVESGREKFSLFILEGLKLVYLIVWMTNFQNPDMYQIREIRQWNFNFRNFAQLRQLSLKPRRKTRIKTEIVFPA